jgi:DNA-binding beta-propeller fold protein YncE
MDQNTMGANRARTKFAGIACTVILAAWAASAILPRPLAAEGGGYHLLTKVALGEEVGWDYLICDSTARRVYIAHSKQVTVVNADTYAVVGEIPGDGVHGIALAPEFGRGFACNGNANTVTIFDLKTLKILGTAPTGKGPDAIIYDPASKRVFAFNRHGGDATAIDAASGKPVGTITLGGATEFAAADGQGYVFNNLEIENELLRIDSRKLAVINRWPTAPCEGPSSMAMDTKHRLLFLGCHNLIMSVVDADSGKVLATPAIDWGQDAVAFDPATGLAFTSNAFGTLTVVHEDTPRKFKPMGSVPTQRGARTMALDLKTHRIFLVTADFESTPWPSREHPGPWPKAIPGTFTLLVLGK